VRKRRKERGGEGMKSANIKDREVPTTEGKAFAKEHNCPFFETSALEGSNISEMFQELAKIMKCATETSQHTK
jgi:hypothetical protein